MRGIHCALEGRLGAAVELRRSPSGKDWARLSVGVSEGDHVTWVSVSVFEEKARALEGLAKGTEVYAEGRLSLNAWTSRDGAERTGLAVTAWRVEVLGQIGGRPGRSKARREHAEAGAFDDAIPF